MRLRREKTTTHQLGHLDELWGSAPDFRSKDAQCQRNLGTPDSGLVPVTAVNKPGHCFVNRAGRVGMCMLMSLPTGSNMMDCCGMPPSIPSFSVPFGMSATQPCPGREISKFRSFYVILISLTIARRDKRHPDQSVCHGTAFMTSFALLLLEREVWCWHYFSRAAKDSTSEGSRDVRLVVEMTEYSTSEADYKKLCCFATPSMECGLTWRIRFSCCLHHACEGLRVSQDSLACMRGAAGVIRPAGPVGFATSLPQTRHRLELGIWAIGESWKLEVCYTLRYSYLESQEYSTRITYLPYLRIRIYKKTWRQTPVSLSAC
jgi:hypothetical protein